MIKSNPGRVRQGVLTVSFFLGCALAATDTRGDDVTYRPDYLAVLGGYSFPSKAYGTTGNGATFSGIYGREWNPHGVFELNIQSSVFETGTKAGTDYYQNGATVDVAYQLFDRRDLRLLTPFALVGIGAVYDDFYPNSRDGFAFIANAGIGAVTRPLAAVGIRLRADARYVRDAKEGGHGEGRVVVGIEVPLGRSVRHVEYLPGKTEIREVVRVVERPWVDSDGDGVEDQRDSCPDTPHGMKVDARGCIADSQTLTLKGVTFDVNTARLTTNAMTVLDLVFPAFVGQPSLRVEIAGHTDSTGSIGANLRLSEERAQAVRSYLISRGVPGDRLTAHGFGKSRLLIDPERTAADRELNRRVDLHVLAQ